MFTLYNLRYTVRISSFDVNTLNHQLVARITITISPDIWRPPASPPLPRRNTVSSVSELQVNLSFSLEQASRHISLDLELWLHSTDDTSSSTGEVI